MSGEDQKYFTCFYTNDDKLMTPGLLEIFRLFVLYSYLYDVI